MKIKLPYGESQIEADINDDNVAGIIMPKGNNSQQLSRDIVVTALANPIGSDSIPVLVNRNKPRQIAIIISDVTRPMPYDDMLPPVLNELLQAGVKPEQVTIVIATGCHRPNTKAEIIAALGSDIANTYHIINHDCKSNLKSVGYLSSGIELLINSAVADAQLKIALGLIIPHKLAGYSGGSKAVLPGVADFKSITENHRLMTKPHVQAGSYERNPVRKQMNEAARLAGVNFILNVVTNHQDQVIAAVAGDTDLAWRQGVQLCRESALVKVPKKCPVAIISCGGYPRDLNVYQAIKPIVNAGKLINGGGTIVVCARCQEGYGDEVFAQWVTEARTPEDIIKRFKGGYALGGHKAYVLAKLLTTNEVVLVSDLSAQHTENLFINYQPDIAAALTYVEKKHGPDYRAWVVPYAGLILPDVKAD
ncbi:nickel-dependent lactate racemase [Peptococcaceae bacterium 1198_IL3148]